MSDKNRKGDEAGGGETKKVRSMRTVGQEIKIQKEESIQLVCSLTTDSEVPWASGRTGGILDTKYS